MLSTKSTTKLLSLAIAIIILNPACKSGQRELNKHIKTMKPNIILIVCLMIWDTYLGCYGGEINTTYLNHLAQNGMNN